MDTGVDTGVDTGAGVDIGDHTGGMCVAKRVSGWVGQWFGFFTVAVSVTGGETHHAHRRRPRPRRPSRQKNTIGLWGRRRVTHRSSLMRKKWSVHFPARGSRRVEGCPEQFHTSSKVKHLTQYSSIYVGRDDATLPVPRNSASGLLAPLKTKNEKGKFLVFL